MRPAAGFSIQVLNLRVLKNLHHWDLWRTPPARLRGSWTIGVDFLLKELMAKEQMHSFAAIRATANPLHCSTIRI